MKSSCCDVDNEYFTRPWCLAELHAAIQSNIPLVPVVIADGGYDFEEGKRFLSSLTPKSLDKENKGASLELEKLGIYVNELGRRLVEVMPNVIATKFDPNGTKNVLNAQIDDIIDRILTYHS